MDNSIYIALSKQTGMFRDLDTTANNIANADTTGFQNEAMLFQSYLVNDGNRHKMAFAQDIATYRDTTEGPLKETNNALDMAIQGPGYFMVETPLGNRYTKAGNFSLDPEGTLITPDGYPVLDANGQRIQFEENANEIEIGEGGAIKVDGEEFAELGVAEFSNEQLLERQASNLYKSDIPPQLQTGNSRVVQGVLEGSNTKPVLELTHMIELSRRVASTAKFIEVSYDLERKTSNIYAKSQ